jgi:hypothetical protein
VFDSVPFSSTISICFNAVAFSSGVRLGLFNTMLVGLPELANSCFFKSILSFSIFVKVAFSCSASFSALLISAFCCFPSCALLITPPITPKIVLPKPIHATNSPSSTPPNSRYSASIGTDLILSAV